MTNLSVPAATLTGGQNSGSGRHWGQVCTEVRHMGMEMHGNIVTFEQHCLAIALWVSGLTPLFKTTNFGVSDLSAHCTLNLAS